MKLLTVTHPHYSHPKLEYEWTNDRVKRFEVFAPDGWMFAPSDVTSFVCVNRADAIERVRASYLTEFVDSGV